ncbi:phosphate transporter [Burkholderia sp. SCN-KJ]|uniref:phosphate transporter n=1 Tax=Burkholderia sp. SCN-KJ TaxID=2969248 RepID=UPI0021501624|nr:phosphate transporter [Burkholderia sp. SCN-KJ]MCR4465613.1 phosphate transporter [Burkholderia sp. SCN-KJ]
MPNLAATETSGAARHRARTISLAPFLPIVACGIVYVGVHLSADPGPVKEGSVLPIMLPAVARVLVLPASIARSAVLCRARNKPF